MPAAGKDSERRRGLDALRGLAAMTVVVHHVLLHSVPLTAAYRGERDVPRGAKLLTDSPLHLVWAGPEAVLIFFVLSGFVLSAGMLRDRRPSWLDYYPRRVVRLYLPVFASLAIALPQARWLRHQHAVPDATFFYNANVGTGSARQAVVDATLWHEKASLINGVIWSLHWEVLFSLALPAYLLLRHLRGQVAALLAMAGVLALSGFGFRHGNVALVYLPVFALGILVAMNEPAMRVLARRWSVALAAIGGLLLTTPWTALGFGVLTPWQRSMALMATLVGATLLVVAFLDGTVGGWAGKDRVVQWLGRRSFSLYLVHAPLITTIAYLLGGHPNVGLLLVLAVPASLVLAEVFGRYVEEPAHRLSQRVGRAVAARRQEPARA
jgi:peptidoglycan/LPS O-acetylase OafA/YrhL